MSLQKICPVPSGQTENIAQSVKRQLALNLQAAYSKYFFQQLYPFTLTAAHDGAKSLLLAQQDDLEGTYAADRLQLFEGLLELAHQGKVLTDASYDYFRAWLTDVYAQMEDDVIIKDLFEKTFYGIAYETKDGRLVYYANAQKERLYERKLELEAQGLMVSPIFAKACYYNYTYNINDARDDFKHYLQQVLDSAYMDLVRFIIALPSALDPEEFILARQKTTDQYDDIAQKAWQFYGRLWHIY